jgi:hypothetical protein
MALEEATFSALTTVAQKNIYRLVQVGVRTN